MSNRTAQANKAVTQAWENEYRLVSEGKGTRDWTPEQQRDILDKGKAYGDDGRTFEGHHMKSVEGYPDFQGDPGNIQFLSRPEHNAAHNGSFQNPTNGYFNPFTRETKDFGDNKYEPCIIIKLSDPVVFPNNMTKDVPEEADNIQEGKTEVVSLQTTDESIEIIRDENPPSSHKTHSSASIRKKPAATKSGFREGIEHIASSIKGVAVQHPVLTGIAKFIGVAAAIDLVDRVTSQCGGSGGNGCNRNFISPSDSSDETNHGSSKACDSTGKDSIAGTGQNEGCGKGTPKAPHGTSGYTRTRFGKEEHVSGYSTGRKRDE